MIPISRALWWTGSAARCYDRLFRGSTGFCWVRQGSAGFVPRIRENLEPERTPQNQVEPSRTFEMRSDSVVFGVAGIFFGVLVGWIIGSQQASGVVPPTPAPAAAAPSGAAGTQSAPPVFDESRAASLKATADRNPSDA